MIYLNSSLTKPKDFCRLIPYIHAIFQNSILKSQANMLNRAEISFNFISISAWLIQNSIRNSVQRIEQLIIERKWQKKTELAS